MVGASSGMPIGEPAWPTVVRPVRIGQLAGDEVGAARRAARLGVVVGEEHALVASRSRFGVRPAMMPW